MLPQASLPTCPACLHTGFLLLQRIPSLPLPPDLLDLLPSIPHYAPHVPPAAILASLPLIADWLQQFPTPVRATAFRTTPPLPVGSSWTSFWSLDYATDWTTASSAPPPLFYWRHPSAGGPWALGPDLPEVPTVCSTPCATCGRPTPHEAAVDHPSSPAHIFPGLFCVHPRRHAPLCTRALAPRCTLSFLGQRLDGAVPVHVLPWSSLCAPLLPQLLLPPPTVPASASPASPISCRACSAHRPHVHDPQLGRHRPPDCSGAPLGRGA